MLTAINLDRQLVALTEEIQNIWPERMLTPELHAVELRVAKMRP